MRRTLFTAVSGQLLLLAFVSAVRAQNGGTWETRAPMPVRRQELATGALAGKIYVLGGYDLDGRSTATVEVYNPATNTWAFARSLPFAVNHNAAAVAGGKLYSFGAGAGETFVYNPNNNSWAARASSHYVHSLTAAVGVINNKIYVAGGTGTPSQRELEVYDSVANTWTIKMPMRVARNHCAGGVINGKFYVGGGRAAANSEPPLEFYNAATNMWSPLASMPTGRSGIAAAVVNDELWVFGGEEVDGGIHAEVKVYNPASNSWRREPDMPSPRHGIWASVIGNKVYIPGGAYHANFAATNTNQIFTVSEQPGGGGNIGRAVLGDFNSDGHPDYVLLKPSTRQSAIWYLNNNVYVTSAYGPTLTVGWALRSMADFDLDTHPDYALFAPGTNQTAIWYLSGPTFIGSGYGPTLPSGWELVAAADFNGDSNPDYVLYKASTHQTAI